MSIQDYEALPIKEASMQDKLEAIMGMAFEITIRTEIDVFVYYSGHVNTICVEIFLEGWHNKECDLCGGEHSVESDWKRQHVKVFKDGEREPDRETVEKILDYLGNLLDENI